MFNEDLLKTIRDIHNSTGYPLIFSCYPGTGKTYCYNKIKEEVIRIFKIKSKTGDVCKLPSDVYPTIVDLDTSNYEKTEGWEKEYVDDILQATVIYNEEYFKDADIVFIGMHDNVIKELESRNIPFFKIYPAQGQDIKDEYFKRYRERDNSHIGNLDKWLEKMDKNWDMYLSEEYLKFGNPKKVYRLPKKFYINEVLDSVVEDCLKYL